MLRTTPEKRSSRLMISARALAVEGQGITVRFSSMPEWTVQTKR